MNELNKRRAEWAGLKWTFFPPDFPNDLNACDKYLIKGLQKRGMKVEIKAYWNGGYRVEIHRPDQAPLDPGGHYELAVAIDGKDFGTTFCLAVDKFITQNTGASLPPGADGPPRCPELAPGRG